VLYLPPRVLAELGSGAIWVISFFVGFYAAVIAVLVRDIGTGRFFSVPACVAL
jgi:hypothetical protein